MSAKVKIDEDERVVTTTFSDGATLTATPNDTPEDRARAVALGYISKLHAGVDEWMQEDLWRMTQDHDLIHTLVSDAAVDKPSIALWKAAHPDEEFTDVEREIAGREERIVLLIQRLINEGPETVARAEGIIE